MNEEQSSVNGNERDDDTRFLRNSTEEKVVQAPIGVCHKDNQPVDEKRCSQVI